MVASLGGMAMDMGDSAFELSTNALSFDSVCELFSPSADNTNVSNVLGVSGDTSSHESLEVHKQSQHSGDDHDDIPLCAGFGREQWVGLDVVLLNVLGVPVVDGICRNSNPRECVDANPLGLDDVGICILNFLLPLEVPLTWRFSLCRWPFCQVLHEKSKLVGSWAAV